jgi:hypothetical protein
MTKDWKERFKKEFVKYGTDEMETDYYFIDTEPQYIEQFIQSELDRQKEEIIKRVESKKKDIRDLSICSQQFQFGEITGYNNALDQLIKELKGE